MLSGPGPSQAVFVFCSFFCFVTEEKAEILHSFTSEPASGTGHNWWLTLSPGSKKAWPGHVTGTTNHLCIILICLKGIDTVVFFVVVVLFSFFGRPKSKQKFWHPSQGISWEKIICQPCCVCPFPYEYVCPVAPNHWPLWARILLVTFKIGTQLLSGALSNFLMTDLLWSPAAFMVGQFSEEKKTQFYFQVTVTLCNIHHRPFFRPHSMSTGAGLSNIFVFLFVFFVLNVADFSKKTLELQKKKKHLTPIFQNLDSLQTTSPLETVGKILQRGRSSCWTVYAANCTKKWHWGTQQCTLPLCVPQPHPTETETTAGLDGSGHLAQYQIRGVSPNAVDLRVFLAFGTVQTEETKIFFWVLRVLS